MTAKKTQRSTSQTSTSILTGLVVGSILGIILNHWGLNQKPFFRGLITLATDPVGDLFLNGLKMMVVPLVAASLIGGVSRLGTVQEMGRLGRKLAVFYLLTALTATTLGQILVSTTKPGTGLSPELVQQAQVDYQQKIVDIKAQAAGATQSLWPGLVTTLVPPNILNAGTSPSPNMLAIIVFSILFGSALLVVPKERALPIQNLASAVEDAIVVLIGWIMKIAPIAVGCLMVGVMARFGFDLLEKLGLYMLTVISGYLIHFFVIYQIIVRGILKYPFRIFLRKISPIVATAFSTSSSAATMPTTIQITQSQFGIKKETASFAISLGTTINMDGTALFECVAILFIAQIFGIDFTALQQFQLVMMVFLSSFGIGGIPGGSIPMIMAILTMFGIPPAGIALILGVDRFLDMGRTVLNVTGDVCGAMYLAKIDGQKLETS